MALGLLLTSAAAIWLSTRPSLSTKARMFHSQQEAVDKQFSLATNSPNETRYVIETKQDDSIILADKLQQPTQPNLPDTTAHEQTEKIKTQKFHLVSKGETLSDISYKYYGSSNNWQKILDANRRTIEDANKLKPGTKLIIP